MSTDRINELAGEYLELKDEIEEAEGKQAIIRDAIQGLMPPYDEKDKVVVRTTRADVTWVKGRTTTRLDGDILRKRLILNGVPLGVVDEAFGAASETTTGRPQIRVSARKG